MPLEYADIKTSNYGEETGVCGKKELSNIIILNADPNATDIDNNNIRNTPFKFTYRFSGLIGSIKDLSLVLENFIVNKFKNNIEEEINLYVPNDKKPGKKIYTFSRAPAMLRENLKHL